MRIPHDGAKTLNTELPLVVDVDGTFIKTDMLFEGFWKALGQAPLKTLRATWRHFSDRAVLKSKIAQIAGIRVDLLPVNKAVADLVDQARTEGREVIFASAADQGQIDALAACHGISGDHLATQGHINLKGQAKADALVARFGKGGFAYAGDAAADLPVWLVSGQAIVVGRQPKAEAQVRSAGIEIVSLPKTWSRRSLARGLRPHQWVKNVLLLLPMIAAHQFGATAIVSVIFGTMSFCAAASSIYLVNDMFDLEADRQHATKRFRPIASGNVRIRDAMAVSVLLGLFALALGVVLGPAFFAVVSLYMLVSLIYSLKLKQIKWLDIFTLASLFTLRVLAGAVATHVFASLWLLAFVFPAFLALGGVKRLTELTLARSDGRVPGRGYTPADRAALLYLAIAATVLSSAVFFAYTLGSSAAGLYEDLLVLRLAGVPFAIWQARMVYLGWHGKQDYDPLVFAMKDAKGLFLMAVTLAMVLFAAGVV